MKCCCSVTLIPITKSISSVENPFWLVYYVFRNSNFLWMYHDWYHIWRRNCLPFRSTFVHHRFLVWCYRSMLSCLCSMLWIICCLCSMLWIICCLCSMLWIICCLFSVGWCNVWPSIYGFWLSLWYSQTCLRT
jgi:hypothetical protein